MSKLTPHLLSAFDNAYDLIRKGQLRTLIPFLSLFRLNGATMSLKWHFQFSPMYNTVQAPNTVWMCGRQLGKSYALCSSSCLRSALIPSYHQLIVQPRADQIQRLNSTVYQPLLRSCPVQDAFISNPELSKLALKTFNNGSLVYLEHMLVSADRVRGVSGAASCFFDESICGDQLIFVLSKADDSKYIRKEISKVTAGDVCISFGTHGSPVIVRSVAVKDASFHGIRNCFKITTVSGRAVTATADHLFPTDHGSMRVGDIIEYEYYERCCGDGNIGSAVECINGQPSWGRLYTGKRKNDESYKLESRPLPRRICETQVPAVARVRNETTVCETESRLREILECIDIEKQWSVSLYVAPNASEQLQEENSYTGISERNNTSDCTGVVVHGRRHKVTESELRQHIDRRLLERGSHTASVVAEEQMECDNRCSEMCAQQLRDGILVPEAAETGLYHLDGTDSSVYTGMHAVQNNHCISELCGLRKTDAEEQETMLLPTLRMHQDKGNEKTVCRDAQGTPVTEETGVERSQQGQDKHCGKESLCTDDERAESGTGSICACLQNKEQRGSSRIQKSIQGSAQKRSCLYRTETPAERTEIPEDTERSCGACEEAGTVQKTQETQGCERAGASVSVFIQEQETHRGSTSLSEIHGAQGTFIYAAPDVCGGQKEIQSKTGCKQSSKENSSTYNGRTRSVQAERTRQISQGLGEHVGGAQGTYPRTTEEGGCFMDTGTACIQSSTEACMLFEEQAEVVIGQGQNNSSDREAERCGEGTVDDVFVYDRIKSIEYAGEQPVYDIEIVGTHNYVLANGICSYNCQDIEYEHLTIAKETMSASMFWGFSCYTGTPKTTDTTLALLWDKSSKSEWVIRCRHCNFFNIPNPEQHLIKMIGKKGVICAKCGRPVDPRDGGYVAAVPDRMTTFPGYHVSQTIHPIHMLNESKWSRILDKVNSYRELELYNEVFGWPFDAATSPLTLSDLQKATYDQCDDSGAKAPVKYPSDIDRISHLYRYITVAVDWSGGGMISDSYTSYAVLGLRTGSDVIDVLYGRRIPKGTTPTEEADEILSWISGSGADAFAYDNGGAGFARLEIMNHQGLRNIPNLVIVPINYVRPRGGDVMQPHTGQRESDLYYYTLDKSRSLAITIMAIKACRIRFAPFDETDETAYQRDFLALREDPRKSLGNETVIIIIKKPGVPDDFAHAVNFGCSQIWDHFGAYPRIGSRYDASILDYDENNNKIMEDDVFGPRGDFERFRDAVEARSIVIEPDNEWI